MTMATFIPVAVGVVNGGLGINFGRQHGLDGDEHNAFLRDMFTAAGFSFPETVKYERNKQGEDGKMYVDWMRLRVSDDECQVNDVNPQEAVVKLRRFFSDQSLTDRYGVEFRAG